MLLETVWKKEKSKWSLGLRWGTCSWVIREASRMLSVLGKNFFSQVALLAFSKATWLGFESLCTVIAYRNLVNTSSTSQMLRLLNCTFDYFSAFVRLEVICPQLVRFFQCQKSLSSMKNKILLLLLLLYFTHVISFSSPRGKTAVEAADEIINSHLPKLMELGASGEIHVDNIDVFCEKGVFDLNSTRRILQSGKEMGLQINFHGDELHPMKAAEVWLTFCFSVVNTHTTEDFIQRWQ